MYFSQIELNLINTGTTGCGIILPLSCGNEPLIAE